MLRALCTHQLYAPPPPPGAYMGRSRGGCLEHPAPGVGKGARGICHCGALNRKIHSQSLPEHMYHILEACDSTWTGLGGGCVDGERSQ